MFTNMVQDQYVWHKAGNFDVKDALLSGRPISGKIDEIKEKIDHDRHINSHDFDQKLNVDHNSFKPFGEG